MTLPKNREFTVKEFAEDVLYRIGRLEQDKQIINWLIDQCSPSGYLPALDKEWRKDFGQL